MKVRYVTETKPRPMAWYSGFHDPGFFFLVESGIQAPRRGNLEPST